MRTNLLSICMALYFSAAAHSFAVAAQVDKGDSPKDQQQQEVDDFEEKVNEIENISKLTNERRGLLREIKQAKSMQMSFEAKVVGLEVLQEETKSRLESIKANKNGLQQYESDLKKAKARFASLNGDGKGINQSEEEYNNEIARTLELIDLLQGMIAQENGNQAEQARLEMKLTELKSELSKANEEWQEHQKISDILQSKLEIVEDKINTLLIPSTAQNEFKLWVTIAFTSLVGLVILGFFAVSSGDKDVRRAIFSSQSGIQFITLFSLVIAIILFGITEILGAKELAALLGGISGYILGRVSESRFSGGRSSGGACPGGYLSGGSPGGRFSQGERLSQGGRLAPAGGVSQGGRFSQGGRLSSQEELSQREKFSERKRPSEKSEPDNENSEND